MGEGILLSARRDDDPKVRRDTVGSPIGPLDSVRVFRPGTEEEVPDGELGELIFAGPTIIRSYLVPPEANTTGFTSACALRSGDLGRALVINGRRCFTMEGRLKDQIVRGGEKFMAEELERLLAAHPAISEVAVVGVPDARLGERVGVFIVCKSGEREPDRRELVAFLRDRGVAKFKWPEQVVSVDALPKSGIGKVQKSQLREQVDA
jgi:non-ribosomal peptide synthetase component E (peptide arylation enzyme)